MNTLTRTALGLSCLFLVSASSPVLQGDALLKYVEKKLRRNASILRLNAKIIGDAGMAELAQSPLLDKVTSLVVYQGDVGDEGIAALAQSKHIRNLKELYLESNRITDAGANTLARSPVFSGLEVLNLYRNRITAIIGPSGCGKSTMLRCFNRMNELIPGARVEGQVNYDGRATQSKVSDLVKKQAVAELQEIVQAIADGDGKKAASLSQDYILKMFASVNL